MFILDDGIKLDCKVDKPANIGDKMPLAIVIHGFTGNKEEKHIVAVSKTLNKIGFATLRVDMYGHGSSEGSFFNHTLFKWLTNALTVIDYALSLKWVSDLYLCGHSQGGLTVMLAAAMKHDLIKGIIPMSPAIMIPEQARKGELLGARFNPCVVPEVIENKDYKWELSGNYVRVAQMIHAEDAFAEYEGPVLLIHGDADESVPVSCSIEAQKAYRNATLSVIKGDTHCYDFHLEDAVGAVRSWIMSIVCG
jgi:pimeloyl-ACP methyl ester carboxylesterase